MKIILGSESPRRKKLLSDIVSDFAVIAPSVDEIEQAGETPIGFSKRMSAEKGLSILSRFWTYRGPCLIITADTIVSIDGRIIGKPKDFQEAVTFITLLNGRAHQVISSITLIFIDDDQGKGRITRTGSESTEVRFRELDGESVRAYLTGIRYSDKAGAYAFQENGSRIVESYTGSASNIIGLPLRLLFSMIEELGISGDVYGV